MRLAVKGPKIVEPTPFNSLNPVQRPNSPGPSVPKPRPVSNWTSGYGGGGTTPAARGSRFAPWGIAALGLALSLPARPLPCAAPHEVTEGVRWEFAAGFHDEESGPDGAWQWMKDVGQVRFCNDTDQPVPLPRPFRAASFAAVPQAATADGNNALLTWSDIGCIAPINSSSAATCTGAAATPAVLQNSAALDPIAATASTYAGTSGLAQTGTGFIFYINGHFFLMQMAALPAPGTVWNARFYAGTIIGTPGDYEQFAASIRPPAVPGLRAGGRTKSAGLRTARRSAAASRARTSPPVKP